MTADVQARLMAIQTELTQVREKRASMTSTSWAWLPEVQQPSPRHWLWEALRDLLAMVFAAFTGLAGLLAFLSAVTGDLLVAAVMLMLGVPLAAASFWLGRPLGRSVAAAHKELNRLSWQERQLLREAAWLSGRGTGQPWVRSGPTPHWLPAPPDRQPSSFALAMHVRFPVGRSPEQALRELPAGAPDWKVAFHRTVGWSGLRVILCASGVLCAYVVLAHLG